MALEKEHVLALDEIVKHRRAVRVFKQESPFDQTVVKRSLELAVLSPNSSNMQLWEFVHVQSPKLLEALAPLCLGQQAARTARAMVAVVVRRDLWQQRCQQVIDLQTAAFKAESGGTLTDKHRKLLRYWQLGIPALHRSGAGIWDALKWISTWIKGWRSPVMRQVTSTAMRLSAHRSAALAAQTFMLSIAAEGLDTCPMEGYDQQRVKTLLNIPKTAEISMMIAIGERTPKGVYGPRLRIPFEEVYRYL